MTLRERAIVFPVLGLALAFLPPSLAADGNPDKNGVAPNTVSVPSGPGSIEGLGESFQPQLNTGSARYAVMIPLPKLHNTPELTLQYESGFGDGPAGIGWRYGPGYIGRQVDKGIPRYVDGPNGRDDDHDGTIDELDETDTFLGPDGEELVDLGDGTFRARIEGSFARYRRVGGHWEADLKSGTLLEFGITPEGRVTDGTETKTFRWLLERSTDANGNVVEYSWQGLSGSDNQKYLRGIRYGPGGPPWSAFYFAHVSYEEKPDWRTDCRGGFLLKTAHRITRIDIGVQGVLPDQCAVGDWNPDGIPDALLSRYAVAYDTAFPMRSFLARVTRYGSDGVNYLPPVSFAYAAYDPPAAVSAADAVIDSEQAPNSVMDSGLVDLVDLNRDGLADILQTDYEANTHTAYLNLGEGTRGSNRVIRWGGGQDVSSADGLAPQLHLAEERVHLADMNGDGIADLVHTSQGGDVSYFPNGGDISWARQQHMSLGASSPPPPFTSREVRTADVDFNKRMDVLMSTAAGYSVWLNYEDGAYSAEVRTPGAVYRGQVIRLSEPGVQLADMNGDRLVDVVKVTATHLVVAPSMGYGRFGVPSEIPIPDVVLTTGPDGQVGRTRLVDVNGDGLADLALERAAAGEFWCWLNLGTDALSRRIVVTGMPMQFGPNTAVRWADLNGNGTTDLVYADSTAFSRIRTVDLGALLGGSAHANLLTRIENGLGVTTRITYRSSTELAVQDRDAGDPWGSTLPFPVQVVTSTEIATGMDVDTNPGEDRYLKHYHYRDGFYEDRERAFRGFAEVAVTVPGDAAAPSRVTEHGFFTGGPDSEDNDGDGLVDEVSPGRHREEEALKGLARYVETRTAAGEIFSREGNTWLVRNLIVSPGGVEVRFASTSAQEELISEKTAAPETIRTTFVHDDFGNVTEEHRSGALSVVGDEVVIRTGYINDTSRWILGAPSRVTVSDGAGRRFSETLSYYDGADFEGLPFGRLSRGNLTRQLGWVGGDTWVNLWRSARDGYGNVTATLDPRGGRRKIAWDAALHAFPVREQIEVDGGKPDLTVTAAYNLGLGAVASSTDFNGHATEFRHDVFGRLTSIVLPGDTVALPTTQFAYAMADPAAGLLYEYDASGTLTLTVGPVVPSSVTTRARERSGAPGTFDTVRYVDGLGRPLAAATEGETGFIVSGAVLFNALGEPRWLFPPFESPSAEYVPPATLEQAAEVRLDAMGREIERIHPPLDPTQPNERERVTTAYLPLRTTVVNENAVPKDLLSDGLDRLVEVREHNGAETYVTRYAYDALGNLTGILDAQDNAKTFAYDGLGRTVLVGDPDRGRVTYEYDFAGNLTGRRDSRGQTIRYAYDAANRPVAEYRIDGSGPAPSVTYHYDEPSADYPGATNLKGRLAWVEDRSGAVFSSFDERGNVPWSARRVVDGAFSRDFVFASEHDALGRVTASAWPDGDRVRYIYNSRSLLESIPGVVEDVDYHPTGQIARILHGNGVQTVHAFDPRQRITRLLTQAAAPGDPLQDLGYDFDGAGNITTLTDNRPVPGADPANATQSFLYDALDRLVRAEGPGYGMIGYQYDAIGNMTLQQSPAAPDPGHIDDPLVNLGAISSGGAAGTSGRGLRLPGEPPGPHAVTSTASGLAFGYDDNGNMTANGADRYEWDFADRLVRARTPTAEARFVYDHGGRRVVKRDNAGGAEKTTYYVSEGYEIREGRPVKHVFVGDRRVARVEGRLTGGGTSHTLNFTAGWNFFSLEVEPDEPAVGAVLAPIAGSYTGVWGFDAAAQTYVGYVPSQSVHDLSELHALKGYLIHLTTPASLTVSGTPASGDMMLEAGWNLVPSPASQALPVAEAFGPIAGQLEAVWGYASDHTGWQVYASSPPTGVNPLATAEPGKSYWVLVPSAATVAYRRQPTRILFNHPDHLGSTNVVTDNSGVVVERAEYYPYGRARHEEHAGFDSDYTFTGKELDRPTGLMYFDARYYEPVTGRFVSVDPIQSLLDDRAEEVIADPLLVPQNINSYSYALNSPLNYVDPTGLNGERLQFIKYEAGQFEEFKKDYLAFLSELERVESAVGQVSRFHILRDPGVIERAKRAQEARDIAAPVLEGFKLLGRYQERVFQRAVDSRSFYAAFKDHKPVAVLSTRDYGTTVKLETIAATPSAKGAGKALTGYVISQSSRSGMTKVELEAATMPLVDVYKSWGFRSKRPESPKIMERILGQPGHPGE